MATLVCMKSLIMLCLLAGCGSRPAMMMTAMEQPVMHSLRPHHSFYSRSPDGMYDIVLVREPAVARRSTRDGNALEPVKQTPIREIVHVRVFWRPPRGTESDHPAAANSAIKWYFLGVGTAQQQDLLVYEGSGFTAVDASGRGISARIRDAYLRAGVQRGELADPLGTVSLTGNFEAARDEARVHQLLQEIRFATEATEAPVPSDPSSRSGRQWHGRLARADVARTGETPVPLETTSCHFSHEAKRTRPTSLRE